MIRNLRHDWLLNLDITRAPLRHLVSRPTGCSKVELTEVLSTEQWALLTPLPSLNGSLKYRNQLTSKCGANYCCNVPDALLSTQIIEIVEGEDFLTLCHLLHSDHSLAIPSSYFSSSRSSYSPFSSRLCFSSAH